MSSIQVCGLGAVSPAGWGVEPLRLALQAGRELLAEPLECPDGVGPLRVLRVPAPVARPEFLAHPRLRRTSAISHFAVAAALQALGAEAGVGGSSMARVGLVLCVMSGCVNYSRRFYGEVLRDPATASPVVFPETVFNAPASHLAALLGTGAINYTLVGDPGTFAQGIALAAEWLERDLVEGCLIVGAEEMDWLAASSLRLFDRRSVLSEGAGALYLRRSSAATPASGSGSGSGSGVELAMVTDPSLFLDRPGRRGAAGQVAGQLRSTPLAGPALLCDSRGGIPSMDQAETEAWKDWRGGRLSPKSRLGEGLMAGAAWQCVAAVDALQRGAAREALVSVAGCNQQFIGARFRLMGGGGADVPVRSEPAAAFS